MEALFSRILDGGDVVFYRQQQKGDEDLTEVEKREILSRVFADSKPEFLRRYLRWMQKSDGALFADASNPLVDYFLEKLERQHGASDAQKRNRRYYALERLKKEGVFFSEKMREREPLLYDRMVGRYLSEDEQLHLRPTITATRANGWAGLLEQFEESGDVARRRRAASDSEWEGMGKGEHDAPDRLLAHVSNAFEMEEEEEDEEVEDGGKGEEAEGTNGEGSSSMTSLQREVNGIIQRMDDETAREEEEMEAEEEDVPVETLREEFVAMMCERFLAGKDSDFFDYSTVDEDDAVDEMDEIAERDREEAWFDED